MGKRDAPTSAEVLRALQLQEVRWQAILDTARDAIIGIEASTTTRAAGPSSAPSPTRGTGARRWPSSRSQIRVAPECRGLEGVPE